MSMIYPKNEIISKKMMHGEKNTQKRVRKNTLDILTQQ